MLFVSFICELIFLSQPVTIEKGETYAYNKWKETDYLLKNFWVLNLGAINL